MVTLVELSALLAPIFDRHGIIRAYVFGSLARGEATRRSDVDLIALQESDRPFLDRYAGILREVQMAVHGHDVDLVIYTPDEFDGLPDTAYLRRVRRESKLIYERHPQPPAGSALA
jgi:predicted nucleotidyltransferase